MSNPSEDREQRIEFYRAESRRIYDLDSSGTPQDELRILLADLEKQAKNAGDHDYALYFAVEIEFYQEEPDYSRCLQLLDEAIQWQEEQGFSPDYFLLRSKGVAFSEKGDHDKAIECYDKALEINPKYFAAWRSKGVAYSRKDDHDKAIEFYDKALEINPKDYRAWHNKGVAFANKGDHDKAIEFYDKALEINPKNSNTWHIKGVAFDNKGDYDKAIELYDKALEINPKDSYTWCDKGVAHSRKGDHDKAIEFYDKALEINPKNDLAKYNRGRSWRMISGQQTKKEDKLLSALNAFDSFPMFFAEFFVRLCKENNESPTKYYREHDGEKKNGEYDHLLEFYVNLHDNFHEKSKEYQSKIQKEKAIYDKRLMRESRFPKDRSLLMFLRKWNSYTPAIPAYQKISVGGGYFIWHGGKGIVIDPGYNFLENFYRAGGSICDIDIIIITHSHDDHTIQLEQLNSLLIKYNDEIPKGKKKKAIHFYWSLSTFKKFSGMVDLTSKLFADRYTILNVGDTVSLKNDEDEPIGYLQALPTYHMEVLSHDYGVGLLFELDDMSGKIKEPKRILMTSDTGLVPLNKKEKLSAVPIADFEDDDYIFERYNKLLGKRKVHLMLLHIGSVKSGEMLHDPDKDIRKIIKEHVKARKELEKNNNTSLTGAKKAKWELKKAKLESKKAGYYANHLGWLGVREVISRCRPTVAVVSEWGEELKHFRCNLAQQLESYARYNLSKNPRAFLFGTKPESPRVIPGDLSLVYSIFDESFFNATSVLEPSVFSGTNEGHGDPWVSYEDIDYLPENENDPTDLYYFLNPEIGELGFSIEGQNVFQENREDIVDCFLHYQKHRTRLWFK